MPSTTLASMPSIIEWLTVKEGHCKHVGVLHPLVTLTIGLVWICFCSAFAHDLALGSPSPQSNYAERPAPPPLNDNKKHNDITLACSLCVYWAVLCGLRLASLGVSQVAYEAFWSCNMAMLLAAGGLATHRPHLASAAAISVSVDQVLWVVDVVGWLLTRIFLGRGRWAVGVAKYLTWPTTTWARRATSTHHLWFLPLVAYAVGVPCRRSSTNVMINPGDIEVAIAATKSAGSIPLSGLSWWHAFALDYALSLVIITAIASVTRCFVPSYMPSSTPPNDQALATSASRSQSTSHGSNTNISSTRSRSIGNGGSNDINGRSSRRNSSSRKSSSRSRSRSIKRRPGKKLGGTSSDMPLSKASAIKQPAALSLESSDSALSSIEAEPTHRGAYLNVNLVYEVWRDLQSLPWIQCSHPSPWVHVPRLLCFWAVLNLPCGLAFAALSTAFVALWR